MQLRNPETTHRCHAPPSAAISPASDVLGVLDQNQKVKFIFLEPRQFPKKFIGTFVGAPIGTATVLISLAFIRTQKQSQTMSLTLFFLLTNHLKI